MIMKDVTQLGSVMAGLMFVWAIFQQWFPEELGNHIQNYFRRLGSYFYPYITITFPEYQSGEFKRSKAYIAIERYLAINSSDRAKKLKANVIKDGKSVVLSMDDYEEVTDEFEGMKIWWSSSITISQQRSLFTNDDGEKRSYKLTCHRKHREIITKVYLHHVLDEGKAIVMKSRQRKLYTNGNMTSWNHIIFEHPSTFDTLAMHPEKKKDILDDLMTFIKSKDYYKKVGRSWKRGYLLYGPPGTGKSSMIAAMANLLDYDIYDLELTSVSNNTDLKKLLIGTTSKSIIVIEDIDCSLDLTGQRKKKKEKKQKEKEKEKEKNPAQKKEKDKITGSDVTLSGLLNFIDGLWSACGSERLIVFTTNHLEKLDPALIRRGRMDKHIELSYCCFETFKVLAKNYLDLESHDLFSPISRLLEETNISPADVAENLMPKSSQENAESCLKHLIKVLNNSKEEARLKAMEDSRVKASQSESSIVESSDEESSDGEG
ncbi:AAA-ATPase At3g28580 [Lactuca sativa]|uniref:AAA+ ATPase domain-containing protein n=1 Tax=Lactuca sativa TaxID=4236 RepID=A0A9R1V3X1_LACSA|nr:AAA-ATPase At3g28580 [Lactuca sativa]KAJ0199141.1 hypothetical protein LSAT_V11C600326410 [Lactuca sativa]